VKKLINKIRKWATLGAFIGAAIAGYWNVKEFQEYKESRNKDRASIDSNTAAVTQVVTGLYGIRQWMDSHDTRHEDHKELHEVERNNP
jgi:hypothetical protein